VKADSTVIVDGNARIAGLPVEDGDIVIRSSKLMNGLYAGACVLGAVFVFFSAWSNGILQGGVSWASILSFFGLGVAAVGAAGFHILRLIKPNEIRLNPQAFIYRGLFNRSNLQWDQMGDVVQMGGGRNDPSYVVVNGKAGDTVWQPLKLPRLWQVPQIRLVRLIRTARRYAGESQAEFLEAMDSAAKIPVSQDLMSGYARQETFAADAKREAFMKLMDDGERVDAERQAAEAGAPPPAGRAAFKAFLDEAGGAEPVEGDRMPDS